MAIDLTNDWRIFDQEEYLKGKPLKYSKWVTLKASWDHDHCEFCADRIDASTEMAYCTTDYYYWICEECYADFKELFEWKLEGKGSDTTE